MPTSGLAGITHESNSALLPSAEESTSSTSADTLDTDVSDDSAETTAVASAYALLETATPHAAQPDTGSPAQTTVGLHYDCTSSARSTPTLVRLALMPWSLSHLPNPLAAMHDVVNLLAQYATFDTNHISIPTIHGNRLIDALFFGIAVLISLYGATAIAAQHTLDPSDRGGVRSASLAHDQRFRHIELVGIPERPQRLWCPWPAFPIQSVQPAQPGGRPYQGAAAAALGALLIVLTQTCSNAAAVASMASACG